MALATLLTGQAAARNATYRIDFSGQKEFYCADVAKGHCPADGKGKKGRYSDNRVVPKEKYRAGEKVLLYFYMIATDTDYYFYLDGEPFTPDYQSGKGYIIRFVMPDHDVKLECVHKNSMVRQVWTPPETDPTPPETDPTPSETAPTSEEPQP